MSYESDLRWAEAALRHKYNPRFAVSEPKQHPLDIVCAPLAMQDGPVQPDGSVRWKLVPSTVTPEMLAELERDLGTTIPSPVRAFWSATSHLFQEFQMGAAGLRWPVSPCDAPLAGVRELIAGNAPLVALGLIPLGSTDVGPVCFDANAMQNGDAPVVELEHELLHDAMDRAALAPAMRTAAPTTRAFLEGIFGAEKV